MLAILRVPCTEVRDPNWTGGAVLGKRRFQAAKGGFLHGV